MESQKAMSMSKEFHHIIRIAGTDIDGTLKVSYALTKIKGIGIALANAITRKANLNPQARIGFLNEIERQKLEDVIANPTKYGIPQWMLNRRKDLETGKDIHLIGDDLTLRIEEDIEEMKTLKSWRGYRHAYGLRVRGQHTRTTGRTGKAMGVKKKETRKEVTT
jgi:small subunit ribosomal protein S13